MKNIITALFMSCLSTMAQAHDLQVGQLQIIHPAVPLVMEHAKSASGYMVIANDGDMPERLLGIETPVAGKATLHTTETDADGVTKMKPLAMIEIPADDIVVLEPGGMHIMLMGLKRPLAEGDMLPATLIFEKAGRVDFEFMVDPEADDMDHSTMDHSNH